jgi:hypothetical protein
MLWNRDAASHRKRILRYRTPQLQLTLYQMSWLAYRPSTLSLNGFREIDGVTVGPPWHNIRSAS